MKSVFFIYIILGLTSCCEVKNEIKKTANKLRDTVIIQNSMHNNITMITNIENGLTTQRFYDSNDKLILVKEELENKINILFFSDEGFFIRKSDGYMLECGKWIHKEYILPVISADTYSFELNKGKKSFMNFIDDVLSSKLKLRLNEFEKEALYVYSVNKNY